MNVIYVKTFMPEKTDEKKFGEELKKFKKQTSVKNIKKYLLAALFNAPSTMNGYYQAEVNHDMPGLVR